MNQPTPLESLQAIDNVLSQVNVNRATQAELQQHVQNIARALSEKNTPESEESA